MKFMQKVRVGFGVLCLVMVTLMISGHHQRGVPMHYLRWPKPAEVVQVEVWVREKLIFEAVYEQHMWLVVGNNVAFNVSSRQMEALLSQAVLATQAVLVQKSGAYEVRHLYGLDEHNAHNLRLTQYDGKQFTYVLGALSADGSSLFIWYNEAVYSIHFAHFYGLLNTLISYIML
jgi:hypothetical protein